MWTVIKSRCVSCLNAPVSNTKKKKKIYLETKYRLNTIQYHFLVFPASFFFSSSALFDYPVWMSCCTHKNRNNCATPKPNVSPFFFFFVIVDETGFRRKMHLFSSSHEKHAHKCSIDLKIINILSSCCLLLSWKTM